MTFYNTKKDADLKPDIFKAAKPSVERRQTGRPDHDSVRQKWPGFPVQTGNPLMNQEVKFSLFLRNICAPAARDSQQSPISQPAQTLCPVPGIFSAARMVTVTL